TVEGSAALAVTALTRSAYGSGLSLARCGRGTRPCQPVRSLPLNRAWKPCGGVLSFGPALSPAVAAAASARATVKAPGNSLCVMGPPLVHSHQEGDERHGGGGGRKVQGEIQRRVRLPSPRRRSSFTKNSKKSCPAANGGYHTFIPLAGDFGDWATPRKSSAGLFLRATANPFCWHGITTASPQSPG